MNKRRHLSGRKRNRKVSKKRGITLYKSKIHTRSFNNMYNNTLYKVQDITVSLPRIQFNKCKLCPKYFTSAVGVKLHMYNSHGRYSDFDCKIVLNRLYDNTTNIHETNQNCDIENSKGSDINIENVESNKLLVVYRILGETEISELNNNSDNGIDILNNSHVQVNTIETKFDERPRGSNSCEQTVPSIKVEDPFIEKIRRPLFTYEEDMVTNDVNYNDEIGFDKQRVCRKKIVFEDDVMVSLNPKSLNISTLDEDKKNWFVIKNGDKNQLEPLRTNKDIQGSDAALDEVNRSSAPMIYDDLVAPPDSECKRCCEIFQNSPKTMTTSDMTRIWRQSPSTRRTISATPKGSK